MLLLPRPLPHHPQPPAPFPRLPGAGPSPPRTPGGAGFRGPGCREMEMHSRAINSLSGVRCHQEPFCPHTHHLRSPGMDRTTRRSRKRGQDGCPRPPRGRYSTYDGYRTRGSRAEPGPCRERHSVHTSCQELKILISEHLLTHIRLPALPSLWQQGLLLGAAGTRGPESCMPPAVGPAWNSWDGSGARVQSTPDVTQRVSSQIKGGLPGASFTPVPTGPRGVGPVGEGTRPSPPEKARGGPPPHGLLCRWETGGHRGLQLGLRGPLSQWFPPGMSETAGVGRGTASPTALVCWLEKTRFPTCHTPPPASKGGFMRRGRDCCAGGEAEDPSPRLRGPSARWDPGLVQRVSGRGRHF